MPVIWRPQPRRLPRPFVEDEAESLSHELGGLSLLGEKPGVEGACERGTIDQLPILLDIEHIPRSATADTDTSTSQPPSLVSETSRESSGPRTPPPAEFVPQTKQAHRPQFDAVPSYNYSYEHSTPSDRPFYYATGELNTLQRGSLTDMPRMQHPSPPPRQYSPLPSPALNSTPVSIRGPPAIQHVQSGTPRSRPTIAERLEEKLRSRREQNVSYKHDVRRSEEDILPSTTVIASAPPSPVERLTANSAPVQYISEPSSPLSIVMELQADDSQDWREYYSSVGSATPTRQDMSYFPTTPQQKRMISPQNSSNESTTQSVVRPRRAVSFKETPQYRILERSITPTFNRRSSDMSPTRSTTSTNSLKSVAPRPSEPSPNLALRPCPRSYPVSGYHDWYTITGMEHLNICPSCMGQIGNSKFRDYFVPSLNTTGARIRCSFSEAWTRLAWIQTFKKNYDNLDLLYEVTRPTGLTCPGRRLSTQVWYRVVDSQTGLNVPKFAACAACVRNVEILMPPLRSTFRRQPVLQEKFCDLSVDSPRFVKYIDLLDAASTKCEYERFIDYFERKCNLRDCRRQRLIIGTWHYIPELPEFTVCEDCYDDVVRPLAAAQKSIARRLANPPRLLPGSGPNRCREASCQLYSHRMRAKFKDAVLNNDYRMLESIALKRFDAESRFHDREEELLRVPEADRGYHWEDEWRRNLELWRLYE
ncbi:conserved hypothetical protein [Talaromyces stipitatus ATCC 10500]|uniref:Ser arg-related nuclear matrix protein n=1 Tax=Talaromyces stipitatus (strain ATCC 10500 / CBS 375.48 / QM 6759 / NRRL 1006) TaxID=441959 RepID=B8LTF4_TALSN|nr:uncharacterized protein TSTA_064930 [Talaromyces stipitatus ATCC 10500]EED23032.1 conserved hypothetical protein [Talaromyces stipitatus ATCC 10500]